MRYAKDNAWYIFRYNLEDYFKAYNVPLPAYSLNIEGRMVHPVTGQILCPFGWWGRPLPICAEVQIKAGE